MLWLMHRPKIPPTFLAVAVVLVLGLRLVMFLLVVAGLTVIVANLPPHALPEGAATALVVVWIASIAVAVGWICWALYKAYTATVGRARGWLQTVTGAAQAVIGSVTGTAQAAAGAVRALWRLF
jgi:hypothetical protein